MSLAALTSIHRILIYQGTEGTGASGGPVTSYADTGRAEVCRIVPMKLLTRQMFAKNGLAATHTLYFDHDPRLDPDRPHRITYGERTFHFRGFDNPDELGVFWRVVVEELRQTGSL